jgi:hypothetical protein
MIRRRINFDRLKLLTFIGLSLLWVGLVAATDYNCDLQLGLLNQKPSYREFQPGMSFEELKRTARQEISQQSLTNQPGTLVSFPRGTFTLGQAVIRPHLEFAQDRLAVIGMSFLDSDVENVSDNLTNAYGAPQVKDRQLFWNFPDTTIALLDSQKVRPGPNTKGLRYLFIFHHPEADLLSKSDDRFGQLLDQMTD